MKTFMDHNFLLTTDTAKHLYSTYAAPHITPIIDYHCHILPQEIYEDRIYENITQVWLGGDHYKWRLMRANGVEEYYITGQASDQKKFYKWAETLEKAIGNPLYHWSHMELQRYFGYHGALNRRTAEEVWQLTKQICAKGKITARNLITQSNVVYIGTTDDPIDSLTWHDQLAADETWTVTVCPSWRPDKAMNIEADDYLAYMKQLSVLTGVSIHNFASLQEALCVRLDYFEKRGCTISDHGLEYIMYAPATEQDVDFIYKKKLAGETLTTIELLQYKTVFMQCMAAEYKRRNWVMQLHFACKRNNNKPKLSQLGSDTGFDGMINDVKSAELADFLNALETSSSLPKTILYSLHPHDDAMIATTLACFQNSDAVGKIQHGSAWWFNDHKTGMMNHMINLGNLGILGNFIGMLTDSRSFLSYTRHEYFRRILCSLVGEWVENGEYPNDEESLAQIIRGICYDNAETYFGLEP